MWTPKNIDGPEDPTPPSEEARNEAWMRENLVGPFPAESPREFLARFWPGQEISVQAILAHRLDPNHSGGYLEAIRGRMAADGAADGAADDSDAEIERVLSPCVCGDLLVNLAKFLRDEGGLRLAPKSIGGFPAEPDPGSPEKAGKYRFRCNRCHRPMRALTCGEDGGACGACECGGLIEADPRNFIAVGEPEAVAHAALRKAERVVAVLLFVFLLVPFAHAQTLSGPARVVDGDTLEVQGQKVRLHGIDAPEIRQVCQRAEWNGHCQCIEDTAWACGASARRHLEELIARRPVTCTQTDTDRYGRMVARCFVGHPHTHIDLGGWMVRQGHAVAYVKYSRDYLPQEAIARGARLGLWSGTFVPPAAWRKGRR